MSFSIFKDNFLVFLFMEILTYISIGIDETFFFQPTKNLLKAFPWLLNIRKINILLGAMTNIQWTQYVESKLKTVIITMGDLHYS